MWKSQECTTSERKDEGGADLCVHLAQWELTKKSELVLSYPPQMFIEVVA